MRALLKGWSLALVLGALLGNGQPHDRVEVRGYAREQNAQTHDVRSAVGPPPRQRLAGEHELRVSAPHAGLELVLKRGVEIRLAKDVAAAPLVLRVAKTRAHSHEIAKGFVPIGPTIELSVALEGVDVSFSADQFNVRAGHRLVLAVERAELSCGHGAACWQEVSARYENGRCIARAVRTFGRRMQFGSLPVQ